MNREDIEKYIKLIEYSMRHQEFLKGAKETIIEQKPAMLISLYHKYSDFFDIKPLLESWNLGYKFKFIKPIDHNVSGETALYCEVR